MKKNSWKILSVFLILYAIIGGFLLEVPRVPILNETIRNLYYHVTMWFSMLILLTISFIYSIKQLRKTDIKKDIISNELIRTGFFLGILGLLTGMIWANFTWGTLWVNDPKLNGVAVSLLIYMAYFVLRNSIEDKYKKAKISAVYNIFAFIMFIVFIMILPRMTDSLHPGNGGNPAFSKYDLDNNMRMVFYPAILGFTLLSLWLTSLNIRLKKIQLQQQNYL